jgi:hypothetical protein
MQCRIDPDAASSASLVTYGVRECVLRARKAVTDLPHLEAADSVRMAAEYKQWT